MLETWKEYDPQKLQREQAKLVKKLYGKGGEKYQQDFKKLYNILICRAYMAMDYLDNVAPKEKPENLDKLEQTFADILDLITETELHIIDRHKREGYGKYGFSEASIKRECAI